MLGLDHQSRVLPKVSEDLLLSDIVKKREDPEELPVKPSNLISEKRWEKSQVIFLHRESLTVTLVNGELERGPRESLATCLYWISVET